MVFEENGQLVLDCVLSPAVPAILPFTIPEEVEEGQLIQISCVVTKGDDPITIHWYKDYQLLHSSSDFIINNVESKLSLLLMRSVTAKHIGKYTCIASNPAGSANFSAELNVQGNERFDFPLACVPGILSFLIILSRY